MTEKGRSRLENALLSGAVATVSALIVWGFTTSDNKQLTVKKDIEILKIEKADKCVVDQQLKDLENRTEKKIDDNYQVVNEKLDLIIKLIEK
jgi:hypothetical protein